MALDPIAERYARTLITDETERLRHEFSARRSQVIADLARRNILPNTAGHFHSEMTRLGLQQIEALANARVDSLLAAHERANAPIDDHAVADIHRETVEFCEAQGRNLTTMIQQQIAQAGMPTNMASAMAGTIAAAISGIEARAQRKLSAKRDEQIMAARLQEGSKAASADKVRIPPDSQTPEGATNPEEAGHAPQPQENVGTSKIKKSWTRDQKIGIGALIFAAAAIIVAVTTPEIRQKIGLEKKPEPISQRRTPSDDSPTTAAKNEPPAAKIDRPISAQCSLPEDLSACQIKCNVTNPHESATSNVSLGFNGIYPYGTRLAAGTETHMTIKKQETLPLPMTNGRIDSALQAFSVEIPSIPPKTTLLFSLWSVADDNQKACTYLKTTILTEQRKKIEKLIATANDKGLEVNTIASIQAKSESLFVPGNFMSPEGQRKIAFMTDREEKMSKRFADLYGREGATIAGKKCMAPVFAAEKSDGNPQYFLGAPSIMMLVINGESLRITTLPEGKGSRIETDPHPPKQYSCE